MFLAFSPWGLDPVGIAARTAAGDGLRPEEPGAMQAARPLDGGADEDGAGAAGGSERR